MKRFIVPVAALALIFAAGLVFAAGPKSYQVTGPVLEVKDDLIVVEKGKERWEVARDKDTKVAGELKPGAKVKIMYQMKAVSVEPAGEAKKGAKKEPQKK